MNSDFFAALRTAAFRASYLRPAKVRGRTAELFHRTRAVLLDLTGDGRILEAATAWADRVDVVKATCAGDAPAALLVRPDGYVVWAAGDAGENDLLRLRDALAGWFGVS